MSNLASVILAVDTCSRQGSISLAREGAVVALWGLDSDSQQSANLWGDVDRVLDRSGAALSDVSALAVMRGPGAFTGLRVGLAALMGLSNATGAPLFGATALEVLARATGASTDTWVVQNAYRNEVYTQRFSVASNGDATALTDPAVEAPEAAFARFGAGPLRVVGSGVAHYRSALDDAASRCRVEVSTPSVYAAVDAGWQLAPAPAFLAGELALLVSARIVRGVAPEPVEPCYIRPSEAELNLKRGKIEPVGEVRIG